MLRGFWKNKKGMSLRYKIKDLRWELKYACQRAWRGYDDCEVFNFGDCIVERIIMILEDFIKTSMSYPSALTEDEWNNILKEMLQFFKNANEDYVDENYEFDNYIDQYNFMQHNLGEGTKLFTKYCYNLWS